MVLIQRSDLYHEQKRASCSLWNSPIFSKPIPFVTITKKLTSADLFCFQKPVILFHYCVPQGRLMLANFKLKVGITHYCGVISGFWNQIERNSLWIINQSVWMLISCCRFNAVMPLNLFFFFFFRLLFRLKLFYLLYFPYQHGRLFLRNLQYLRYITITNVWSIT